MKNKPQRMCAVCRQHKDAKQMVRVVKTKDNAFYVDKNGKIEGRGAYICLDEKCVETFIKTRSLNKSFKCEVPQEIYENVKEELNIAKSANNKA